LKKKPTEASLLANDNSEPLYPLMSRHDDPKTAGVKLTDARFELMPASPNVLREKFMVRHPTAPPLDAETPLDADALLTLHRQERSDPSLMFL
jgi:hypothetical protein